MSMSPEHQNYIVHGAPIRLQAMVDPFAGELQAMLGDFADGDSDMSATLATGSVRPFDAEEVSRCVSSEAQPVPGLDDLIELYVHGERYWLVDDRWGICEVNLLKRQWRSWILPSIMLESIHLLEAAVLWPMAQLLRGRGLELLPAISVENNGWGALVIAPYGIAGELECLLRSGYRLIGQHWTALRAAGNRVSLMHLPGKVRMPAKPGALIDSFRRNSVCGNSNWRDLSVDFPAHISHRAWCQAVFVVAPGRRSVTRGRDAAGSDAIQLLRHAWPIIELPINRRRQNDAASLLAKNSVCMSVELSRKPDHLARMMEGVRLRRQFAKPDPKVMVSINPIIRGIKARPLVAK
jgi:hypothetical protein